MKKHILFLSALTLIPALLPAAEVVSQVYGATKQTLTSSPDGTTVTHSSVAVSFQKPAVAVDKVSSITGSNLTVQSAVLTDDEFNNGGLVSHYVVFKNTANSSAEGLLVDIVDTQSAGNTLVLSHDVSALIAAGDDFEIRPHVTLVEVFGTPETTGIKGGTSMAQSDLVYLFDDSDTASFKTYWYYDNNSAFDGWYAVIGGSGLANNVAVPIHSTSILATTQTGTVQLTQKGEVKQQSAVIPVSGSYFSVAPVSAATTFSLVDLNLVESGFTGGTSSSESDLVHIFKTDGSTSSFWYYSAGSAYDGFYPLIAGQPVPSITPGTGVFLEFRNPANFSWVPPVEPIN